jgi:predicted metal-dependent hydrolase
MAFKEVNVDGIGAVKLYKRKNNQSVRLRISTDGIPIVTLPRWTPYYVGLDFIKQHSNWLRNHAKQKVLIRSGSRMFDGKKIFFLPTDGKKFKHIDKDDYLRISLPIGVAEGDNLAQKYAQIVCGKLLLSHSEQHLISRLKYLSNNLNIPYNNARVKQLKSRWGSCSSSSEITLSSFLCQLPERLIDYVIIHELTHTNQMNHGSGFYTRLSEFLPDYLERKKQLKNFKPTVYFS